MESSAKLFQRMYQKRYKAKYPDRVRAIQNKYYHSHKEKILELRRRYRKRHREKANKWALDYYYANKEKVLEKAKLYYKKNRERLKKKNLERYYKKRGITPRQQGKLFYQECVKKFGLPWGGEKDVYNKQKDNFDEARKRVFRENCSLYRWFNS